MRAPDLYKKLEPFSALVNRGALSINYRALHLTPTHARGCSAFGAMETELGTGLNDDIYLDGDAFLQVLRSLPASDLEMQVASGSLAWKCGAASGQLAGLGDKVVVPGPEIPDKLHHSEVGTTFARALECGALACGSTALLSVGLYGTHIANDKTGLAAYASDNTTMSTARLGNQLRGAPESFVVSPDGVRIITMLADRGKMTIAFDDSSVYCTTPDTRLVVRQIPPLKFSVNEIMQGYRGEEIKIDLDRSIITSFIRRAEALAEERGRASVTLSVEEGAVKLAFSEGRASSEEYYLAKGPRANVDPIIIDARRLARALASSTHIVFDYVGGGALVLHGASDFVFVVSGRRPQAADK